MKHYIFICDTFNSSEESTKSSEIIISQIYQNLKDSNTKCLVYSKNSLKGGYVTSYILKIFKNKKSFFMRALSDLFFSLIILKKKNIPENSILIFYTPPPIIPFIFFFLNRNLKQKSILLVRDIFPECLKHYLNFVNYNVLNLMQKYVLNKVDKILIESNYQKSYFLDYKNVFQFKNPLNEKRISSINLNRKNKNAILKGIYFGNYGLQHENVRLKQFLELSKKKNIVCKYVGPRKTDLQFTSTQKPLKFKNSKKVLNDVSFQLVSVNDYVLTDPLPYKLIELAALGIAPIFFANENHYFHNEIKKFNMGISVANIQDLNNLFNGDNKIYNLDFNIFGKNSKKYVFKNHIFNLKDRCLFK